MPDKTAPENTPSNAKPELWLRVKEKWQSLPDIVRERSILLGWAVVAGLFFAKILSNLIEWWLGASSGNSVSIEIGILLMSLPVLYVLWKFRTTDTQEQIQETRENAKAARDGVEATRDALNADTLGRYTDMLFSSNLKARCVGLIRLAQMKRQGIFAEEIDIATRRRLDLNKANLHGENLSGVNLEGTELNESILTGKADFSGAHLVYAKMHKAILIDTILVEADLQWSTLTEAVFNRADLRNAKLQNADLSGAKELDRAILKGAKYNDGTKFPEWFEVSRKEYAKVKEMEYVHDTLTRP